MNKTIKSVLNNKEIKASIVYIICSLLSKGLAIITVPIFTRLLSTEQMGVVNLFNSWQGMIASFATLSLTSGGYMAALKEYCNNRDSYMSSVLTLTSVVAIFLFVIYFCATDFWRITLGLSKPLCILMLFTFLLSPATDFWLARQRYEYKYILAGIVIIIPSILASIVSIVSVILFSNNGVYELGEVRIFSSYSITLLVSLILWIKILSKGKTYYNKEFWTYSLKLSLPLIGNSISMQVLSVSDRTMISKMIGNDALGIYGVIYSVSSASLIVWNAINSSFVPYLYENIERTEKRVNIKKTSIELLALYGGVSIFLSLLAPEVVQILATKDYYEAIYIMPPIAAGVFLTAVSNMYSNVLIYYKKTQYIMISSSMAAILNIGLNFVCIRKWGYMAAAYTTLASYLVLAFLQWTVSMKVSNKLREGKKQSVYDDKLVLELSIIVVVLCMLVLGVYDFVVIRYIIVVAIIVLCIIFRNQLLNEVKYK